MACAVPFHACGHTVVNVSTEMGRARSRESLSFSTPPPSLLCCHCPPCLHLFYLFVPISRLCLQQEVQSLVSTEVTWYRLAANLEKETLSPMAEKQGFQMEAASLLSSSILPLKKVGFAMLNKIFHPLRTVLTVRNYLLVDHKSEKWLSSPWCLLVILQSCQGWGEIPCWAVYTCVYHPVTWLSIILSLAWEPVQFCYSHKKLPSPFKMHR